MSMRSMRCLRRSLHVIAAALACAFMVAPNAPLEAADVMAPTAPSLGVAMSPDAISAWQMHVFPDGTGLPNGSGSVAAGADLFAEKCASCHGGKGEGATAEELVGPPTPPTPGHAAKTIGAYWPFATTLFDFIRRSKPPLDPQSLSANDVYALVAFLLNANGVIPASAVMDQTTLPAVKMPNRDGFQRIDAH